MHIRCHALFMESPAERLAPACSTCYILLNIVRAYNATYDDDDDDDDDIYVYIRMYTYTYIYIYNPYKQLVHVAVAEMRGWFLVM